MKKFSAFVISTFILFIPLTFSLAQTPASPGGGSMTPASPEESSQGISLANPLGDKGLMEFLQEILGVIMIFAVPLIVFMIIYAGFMYVTAQGNENTVSKAHKALLYALVGGVIILGANLILAVIQGTVDAFR